MTEKVRRYIDCEIRLDAGSRVYVAISGGADSTALLLIMQELGYDVQALHCNFHLRGEESNRDQTFVEELCKQQDVALFVKHFQTEEYARQHGISIEMAARDLRYGWFQEQKGGPVAVAHHREDQAETLLLNLLRGTGLRGLAAMKPSRQGIIRPLLCLSKDEILDYLRGKSQSYMTDSTNLERHHLRNRLRLDVLPLLRDINPAAVEHLAGACDNVRKSIHYYKIGIEQAFREHGITQTSFPLDALQQPELLHEWLSGKGFNGSQEAEMLAAASGVSGRMWHSESHTVVRDRVALLLSTGKDSLPACNVRLVETLVSDIEETGPNVAYFDADLLKAPIVVRPVRTGDAFVPFGMKGRKLVSDFLTDVKMNRLEKANQLVATCGDDIIWLIGHRSDNRYRVTDKTLHVLKVKAERVKE